MKNDRHSEPVAKPEPMQVPIKAPPSFRAVESWILFVFSIGSPFFFSDSQMADLSAERVNTCCTLLLTS